MSSPVVTVTAGLEQAGYIVLQNDYDHLWYCTFNQASTGWFDVRVRLGLDEGDGVITNVLSAEDVGTVLAHAGPIAAGKEFVVKVFVCPTGDARYARAAGRRFLGWITNQPPYRAFHDWLGRGDLLAPSRARFDAGDPDGAGRAIPDDIVDALWIHGTPDECRERIRTFARPGVTTVLTYVAATPELATGAVGLRETIAALRPAEAPA